MTKKPMGDPQGLRTHGGGNPYARKGKRKGTKSGARTASGK
jgi:hypothetical protein